MSAATNSYEKRTLKSPTKLGTKKLREKKDLQKTFKFCLEMKNCHFHINFHEQKSCLLKL